MPKKIDDELTAKAGRLVREHRQDYPSVPAASFAVAARFGEGNGPPLGGSGRRR